MYICKGHMFVALHFIDFGVKRNPDYYGSESKFSICSSVLIC